MIETAFFYAFSAVLLLSALLVISARNPVHAVLWLILAFFNAAGLFVMLGAEFIAMILVIVYVGAVAVLFLFVVMMLDITFETLRGRLRKHAPVGAGVGGILVAELIWLYSTGMKSTGIPAAHPIPDAIALPNTQALGEILYTFYAYLFEVAGLILLVAMIGAITLTHRGRGDVRRQDISRQVHRSVKDVLKIEKIKSGAGVS
jgi:NADH-quinone oxidoreductase subunit J